MENVTKVTDIYRTSLFPYIESDLVAERDEDLVLTIAGVFEGDMPGERGVERKVIVRFQETDKALILNKTNAQRIWALYGRKTAGWIGKPIALYNERIKVGGRMRNAIRVRHRAPQVSQAEEAPQEPQAEPGVGPSEFWTEFNALKREGKLPNAEALRHAGPIADAKRTGDWDAALKWLHGQMQV